jgi:adenosylmethionine-8-amino-7-oxononanoate aminotransferase
MTTASSAKWVFPRDVQRDFRVAVRGEGVWIWDREGRSYIDADSGAISVISIGHGSAEVADAISEQARTLAYVHNGQFENEPAEQLARDLAQLAPGGLNRSIFVSGGSEAVETAIKLARQYHMVRGNEGKHVVISRRRSYHGATLLALAASGIPTRQAVYAAYANAVVQVDAPYLYRREDLAAAEDPGAAAAEELRQVIEEVGPDRVSVFIAEPVVAAAGPGITPPPGYYERVREICDEHDVLFVADEVVTGFGRTGRNFGIEHWDAQPDIIVTAKGIGGGYVPLAAVIMSDEIAATFESRGTSFVHGLTNEGHPVACAAGLAVLRVIARDDLVANAARQGDRLFGHLREIAGRNEIVGDVRGLGLLAGVEFVADRATKKPLDPALDFTRRLHMAAQERGLMIYQGAPAHAGSSDQILISPPLSITADEIDLVAERLEQALGDVEAGR